MAYGFDDSDYEDDEFEMCEPRIRTIEEIESDRKHREDVRKRREKAAREFEESDASKEWI